MGASGPPLGPEIGETVDDHASAGNPSQERGRGEITLPAARRQDVAIAESDPPAPAPNPLLQDFRGHRTRTWGPAEARKCLEYVGHGMSVEAACLKAGIPVDAPYSRSHGPNAQLLADAIADVYAHEGMAVYEDALSRIALGDGEVQRTGAVLGALKLHGRLRDREQGPQGASITIQIVAVDGAEIRARLAPGTPASGT